MIKLAGIQISCSEEKERNIEKAIRFAHIAIEKGANFICFQELFTTHWFPKEMDKKYFSLAEEMNGSTIKKMQRLAEEFGVVLICPIFEIERNTYYNSAIVVDAGGEILGSYRKIHVPQIPLWEEKYYFSPGDHGFPIFNTKFAPIGVQICWDNFFPEGSRILALKGAKIIFSPTAAAFASQKRWQVMMMSNAIANGVYIFRVNRVGSEEKQDFYGQSFCVSPEGELLDEPTGLKDSVSVIEIDLKRVDKVRKEWPFMRDRRPEVYYEITGSIEQTMDQILTTSFGHER